MKNNLNSIKKYSLLLNSKNLIPKNKFIYIIAFNIDMAIIACIFHFLVDIYHIIQISEFNKDFKLDLLNILFLTIIMPMVETTISQWLPSKILSNHKSYVIFYVSWIIFLFIHISNSPMSIIIAGFFCGCFLSATYVIWLQESAYTAFIMTYICHSSWNTIVVLFYFYTKK